MDGRFRNAGERQAIEAEATRLFLKARTADTDADWAEALAWVAQDPAHGYAFAKAEAAWDLSERLCEIPGERVIAPAFPVAPAARHLPTRRIAIGAMAAGALGVAATAALWLDDGVDRYRTGVGEKRVVRLADGSVIRLNTDSVVEVALTPGRRSLRLLRGEASFDVAPDKARPFVVSADGASVRAVGTAFTVRLRSDLTEVTVTHGVVAVRDCATAERRVVAGNAAAVRQGAIAVTALARGDIDRRLAWQHGRLSFDGDTLAQAVEEFNRYRATPIVIGDPMLAGVRIGGTFRADRSDDFARALEQSFGIRAVPVADGSLLLVPVEPAATAE